MRMILAALALTALIGGIAAAPAPEPHPALLTGEYWAHLAPHEKQIYLAGFIAGAAVEQARGEARAAGAEGDSLAVSTAAVERMRRARTLRYRFATSVYSAQLDDYYWWDNHVTTPIADVMVRVNGEMLRQQREVP
jgi:hypothetical protein